MTESPQPPTTAVTARRWTKYGKDRVYVNTADGERVGWLDLASGAEVIERPDLVDGFQSAVAAYRVTPPVDTLTADPRVGLPPADRVDPVGRDLAVNRPGAGVRQQALVLRADMKERSRTGAWWSRLTDRKTDERAYRVGAKGEATVGARLERLGSRGWRVLHSIPVGRRGADIDHLLIGPGGIYTINTKNHPGKKIWVGERTVLVNGQKTDYLPKARSEANRAQRLLCARTGLDLPVRPVLVFLTGTFIPQVTIKAKPADVLVVNRMDMLGAFRRAARSLDSETVERVYAVARRSTTWS